MIVWIHCEKECQINTCLEYSHFSFNNFLFSLSNYGIALFALV